MSCLNFLFLFPVYTGAEGGRLMDERDHQEAERQGHGQPRPDDYMPPEAAAAYERKAKIIGLCIFLAVLLAGVIVFNIGRSAWEPLPREAMLVPAGKGQAATGYAQDTASYPQQPQRAEDQNPQAVWDPLLLAHPRNAYDLPVREEDAPQSRLRLTDAEVKSLAPRRDKMSDGSVRQNLYARTEFYMPEVRGVCFFYQYMGTAATYKVGDRVRVQYDTSAKDVCGTSRIVK